MTAVGAGSLAESGVNSTSKSIQHVYLLYTFVSSLYPRIGYMFTFSYPFKYISQACKCWEIRRVTLPNTVVRTSYESIRHGHWSSEIVILRYVKSYPQLRTNSSK